MINHLCIIGVGLIGSSLALSLKKAGFVNRISGYGRSESNLKKGVELGVLDDYSLDAAVAVKGADVVVLAVPLGSIKSVLKDIQPHLSSTAVITDVGSAKATVIDDALQVLGDGITQFVGGHPIAGTEKSGVEAGFDSLYIDRKIILTPQENTNSEAIKLVIEMWQATGAVVEKMTVEHHDMILAATSHLPHMLAFSLVSHLSKMNDQDEIFSYAAGGFRDFTRIASSDPVMWRDICLSNSAALLQLIEGYQHELDDVKLAIAEKNPDKLFELFRDAKHTRDQLRNL